MESKKRALQILIPALLLSLSLSCGKGGGGGAQKANLGKDFVFERRPSSGITFLSTQMNPVEEAAKMRNSILKDFPGKVDFRPNDNSYLFSEIESMAKKQTSESFLIGALHGDLVTLYEGKALRPLNEVYGGLEKRRFAESLVKLSRLDGKDIYYIPWMQASFVMVANKKALAYLPQGASLDTLTYEQLAQWAKTIYERTGMKALGFPAGEKGLMHRFFQGYLYPSFTGSTLLKFRGSEAKDMWEYFKGLWQYVHPGSLTYSTMAEPLITQDVWIAWDHTARLVKAFEKMPEDFVAFPAPLGPKGRGFMAVVSGLGVPREAKAIEDQAILIDYLTQPAIQDRTLSETGFFPVIESGDERDIPRNLRELSAAVNGQADSSASILTLPPIGLGEDGNDYNRLFMLAFSGIVLEGADIQKTLDANAAELQRIMVEENAKCWLPDVSDERPCRLE